MPDLWEIAVSSRRDSEIVHKGLRSYNSGFMTRCEDYNFHIEKDGAVAAGIVAGSVSDTLEIEFLYVDEKYRNKGLGKKLLLHAEEKAAKNGIKRVILNTYSFQAPGFYEKLGYEKLFEISPCFSEHSQYYFIKYLGDGGK